MTIREMMAMYHSLQFVEELLDYIEQYPDDDYMTMECLCRKLVKYKLMKKIDGYYMADRKTEPNLILPERMERGERFEVGETIVVMNRDDYYDLLCKSWKDESHTDAHDEAIKAMATLIKAKTEPQTCSFSDCDNFKNPDYERCIKCKRKQIKLKTEQTEREGEW